MKKWIAIILALLLCVPVCAALSEEEPLTVNWSDISPILAAYGVDGEFVTLDSIGLKVFLFPELKVEEISPGDAEAGLLYDFTVANGKYWLRIVTVDVGEMTLDAFYEMARKDTSVITNVVQILVDSLPAVTYDYVEGTKTCPVAYLEGIFVTAAERRKGIARKLLLACESWARKRGCTEFASDCELSNLTSQAFHQAVGFEEANRIVAFVRKI